MPRGSLVDGQSEAFHPIPSQRVDGTASDAMARGNRMFYRDRYNILTSSIPKFPTTSASINHLSTHSPPPPTQVLRDLDP